MLHPISIAFCPSSYHIEDWVLSILIIIISVLSGLTVVGWGKFVAKQKCGQAAGWQLLFNILFSLNNADDCITCLSFLKKINDTFPWFAHQTCKILVHLFQNFIYLTFLLWVHSRPFGTVEVLRKGFHISQRTLRPDQSLLFLFYLKPKLIWGMYVNGES